MEFGLEEETAVVLAQQLTSPQVKIRQVTRNKTKEQFPHKQKISMMLLGDPLVA